jgi:hypothetical protein
MGVQRRIELGRSGTAPAANLASRNVATQTQIHSSGKALVGSFISISYLEKAPLRVRGLTTGRTYEFSAADPVCEVDLQDASALLNTRFFRRA